MAKKQKSVADRFDVVVYNYETRVIERIVGKSMPLNSGSFYTAEKRLETMLERLNEKYNAHIVPAGVYRVGDTLP